MFCVVLDARSHVCVYGACQSVLTLIVQKRCGFLHACVMTSDITQCVWGRVLLLCLERGRGGGGKAALMVPFVHRPARSVSCSSSGRCFFTDF